MMYSAVLLNRLFVKCEDLIEIFFEYFIFKNNLFLEPQISIAFNWARVQPDLTGSCLWAAVGLLHPRE